MHEGQEEELTELRKIRGLEDVGKGFLDGRVLNRGDLPPGGDILQTG